MGPFNNNDLPDIPDQGPTTVDNNDAGEQGGAGGYWLDKIVGTIADLSGVGFGIYDRTTGLGPPANYNGGYSTDVPKVKAKISTLGWFAIIAGSLAFIGLIIWIGRKIGK